jgi:hypothetical protein
MFPVFYFPCTNLLNDWLILTSQKSECGFRQAHWPGVKENGDFPEVWIYRGIIFIVCFSFLFSLFSFLKKKK